MVVAASVREIEIDTRSGRFHGRLTAGRPGKVLIATNDATHRASVTSFLLNRGHHFVTVESPQAAILQLRSGGIDLVVTALSGSDADGLDLTRRIRETMPGIPVILVTSGGAEGVDAGLDCAIGLQNEVLACGEDELQRFASLSPRERQVLDLIVAGYSNKVMAYELSISVRTVENHRARVMAKMSVRSVAELVRLTMGIRQSQKGGQHQTGIARAALSPVSELC